MTSKTLAVYRKEIIDALRDGRSLFAIFVFPFILYPAMMGFMSWIQNKNTEDARALSLRIGMVGEAQIPGLADSLRAVRGVEAISLPAAPVRLEGANVDAVLEVPDGIAARVAAGDSAKVQLVYKESENRSSQAAERLEPVLDQVRRALTVDWARSLGANAQAPPAFTVEKRDVSSKDEMGRFFAALLIPYLLVFLVAAGSMHMAVDATTGEKERSTLETILATAATRGELVLGKTMAVLTASLTGALTGITGLFLTFNVIAPLIPGAERQSMQFVVGPDKAVLLLLTMIPAAIFISATLVAIGCFARGMREGQAYASYFYMATIFLGLGSFGQQSPPPSRFFIPVLNTALLQREILTDTVNSLHALTAVGTSCALAAIMLVVAVRLFSNESVLFRT
ncbi:MAG TPA: ABC transporter permease [Candidatus Eisenbacteria bacterium]|nr:ABC transporter permease [Candidatus Eisenbacteria bacterium]